MNNQTEVKDPLSPDQDAPNSIKINTPTIQTTISINLTSIVKYLVITAIILLVLNILVIASYQIGFGFPVKAKFYFDREGNVPSYFSSFILLLAAAVLGLIAVLKRKENDSFAKHWTILTLIFFGLSLDESVSFHEVLIEPLRTKVNLSAFRKFHWAIVGSIFVLVFTFFYIKFFLALTKRMKILFLASAITYVSGVIGFEMIGVFFFIGIEDFSQRSLPYMIVMTIEESLEMSGILLFIFTLLLYLKSYRPNFSFYLK